jgi:hypothetical protein
MYCKICGEQLNESSAICQVCGTKVPPVDSLDKAEIIFNATPSDSGFSSKPKEKKDEGEFYWNVHDFGKTPKKEEPLEFVWDDKEEKFDLPKSEAMEAKKQESVEEIDKFFTLNKKSEDFQRLLDKEFEKLSIDRSPIIIKVQENSQPIEENSWPIKESSQPIEENFRQKETIEKPAIYTDDLASKVDMAFSGSSSYYQTQGNKKVDYSTSVSGPEDRPRKKGRIFLIIILAIIAVIVVVEAGILGIKYFLPDSSAAGIIVEFQKDLSKSISSIFGGSEDNSNVNNPDDDSTTSEGGVTNPDGTGDGTQTPIIIADPIPMADKVAMVASQLSNNINIKEIKYSDAFKYSENITYRDPDIAKSLPIANNIWYKDKDDKPYYFEQSAVASIVKFDSLWIDYVNSGNEDAIDLTKEDTEARENVLGFDRSTGLTEEFLLLEIGEIRQSTNYLYVWTHERIKVTDNGKSVTKDYKWIYQLEPVDKELKIVNYFRY